MSVLHCTTQTQQHSYKQTFLQLYLFTLLDFVYFVDYSNFDSKQELKDVEKKGWNDHLDQRAGHQRSGVNQGLSLGPPFLHVLSYLLY